MDKRLEKMLDTTIILILFFVFIHRFSQEQSIINFIGLVIIFIITVLWFKGLIRWIRKGEDMT